MSFDDQIGAALDSTAASLREHLEAELRAVSREAARLASEHRQQAVKAAETAAAEVRAQAESQVAQIRAAAQKHAEELKRAAEAQIADLRRALEELRTQAQQQIETARRVAQTEAEKAHSDIEKAHAELQQAHAELQQAQAELEQAHAEIQTGRAESAAARSEAESARAEAETARAETDAVRENMKQEIAKAEAAHSVSEQNIADAIGRAHADSHQAELSRAERLVDAIRSLDEARGLSEVLERLVQLAGHEVDRAAVLLVKGDRLTGWRLAGFAPDTQPANSIDLTVEDAGLAGVVLRTGVAASRPSDAGDDPRLPPFAGDSGEHHAMALPVRVGGEVVAVLYADAPRIDEPSSDARWPAILEILVRHASRVLEAMTVQKAAGLSMPRPMAHGSHAGSAP